MLLNDSGMIFILTNADSKVNVSHFVLKNCMMAKGYKTISC